MENSANTRWKFEITFHLLWGCGFFESFRIFYTNKKTRTNLIPNNLKHINLFTKRKGIKTVETGWRKILFSFAFSSLLNAGNLVGLKKIGPLMFGVLQRLFFLGLIFHYSVTSDVIWDDFNNRKIEKGRQNLFESLKTSSPIH